MLKLDYQSFRLWNLEIFLFSTVQIWALRARKKDFFLQFFVDILTLRSWSGSVDLHIFADPDPGSQNLADPTDTDAKQWFNRALPSLQGDSEVPRTIPLIQDMFGVPKAGSVSVSDKFDRKSWPLHLAARKEISNQEETCSFSKLSCLYVLIIKHYFFLITISSKLKIFEH